MSASLFRQTSVLFQYNFNSKAQVVVNQGGTSSGKTYSVLQVLFCLAYANAKLVITVVGQDIPNLKAGVLRDAHNIVASSDTLQKMVEKYNDSDRIFKLRNGSGCSVTARSRIHQTKKRLMTISKLISAIVGFIKSLFGRLPPSVETAIHVGVSITQNLKNFIESPTADIMTAIIPGELDDKLRETLRLYLPEVLIGLKIIDKFSSEPGDGIDKLKLLSYLTNLQSDVKNATLHSFAVLTSQLAADGKLGWSDGVYLVEWYYQNKFKPGLNYR